jgi:ABC-type lipoprotein release transport system permease subunit
MPFVIGLGTALIAVATIAHGLAISVRRRRRDLAILKTLGFGRRQVVRVVLWQATTIAIVGLVIGIPLGIISGRLAWQLVADQLGVLAEPAVSLLALILLVPAVLLVANLAAMFPGRMAARMRPAMILRGE